MKPRIPLAYAGLLIIALVAVVGFAAFSPTSADEASDEQTPASTEIVSFPASARVASAVLALRVSDAESRTATTEATDASPEPVSVDDVSTTLPTTTSTSTSSSSSSTTESPTTTEAPTTTNATPPKDTSPPALRIAYPSDGATVTDPVVIFEGTTEVGASVSSGPYNADVDSDGEWTITLVMAGGANGAVITATDAAGNETTQRLVIHYDAPAAATTTTQAPTATTTTSAGSSEPDWSPLWPADAGGRRDVEVWRPLVAKYWPAELVSCALNIIDLESHGNPRAYNSSTGAEGLFQHLGKYWKGRAAAAGFKDADGLYATPYNAEANIAAAWVIARGSDPWHRPWTVNPYYGDCAE